MEDGRLDQEVNQRLFPVTRPQLSERRELLEVGLALDADDLCQGAESRCGEELEEEVVAVPALANERTLQPALELLPSRPRQPVDRLVRSRFLRNDPLLDEVIALEAIEDLVQVADVELAPLRADGSLELPLSSYP